MSEVYKIEKITDLLKIPADRIHDCLTEIADQFIQLKATIEATGVDIDDVEFDQEVIHWVDDGKRNATATIKIDNQVLKVSVDHEQSKPVEIDRNTARHKLAMMWRGESTEINGRTVIFNESGCFDVRQNFGSGHFSQSLKATLSYLFGANQ